MRLRHRDLDLRCLDIRELRLSRLNAGGERKGTADQYGDESFHKISARERASDAGCGMRKGEESGN